MSNLSSVIKKRKTTSSSSDKGPKFYIQQKKQFINEMSLSPEVVTRIQVAGSEFVPATILRSMLKIEEDSDVLRTLLLNPRTPMKAVEEFAQTDLAKQFDDDEEITIFLASRTGTTPEDEE